MDLADFIDIIQQDSSPKNHSIQTLDKFNNLLKVVSKDTSNPKLLMDCIIKFLEYAVGIISLIDNYREQICMSNKYFETIKNIVLDNNLNEVFVREVTKTMFEVIIEEDSKNWCIKKTLLKIFNSCITESNKLVRHTTAKNLPTIFLFKMIDSISTYGDYELQVTLIETVFRMYGRKTIHSNLEHLIPESQEISQNFAKITSKHFEEDVRIFLNHLNKNSGRIFSISCDIVKLGEIVRRKTVNHPEGLWVDFNLYNGAISWYCTGSALEFDENEEVFYEILTLVSDVGNVEIHRDPDSPILVQFTLKNPSITQDRNIQSFVDKASSLILIIENNHLGTNLIDHILPKLFGKKVASDKRDIGTKISRNIGDEYQPLGTKSSKHGSITSVLNPTITTTISSYPSKITSDDEIASVRSSLSKEMIAVEDDINRIRHIQRLSGRCSSSDNEVISIRSSLSEEMIAVKDDINRIRDIQILSGRCSGSHVNYFNSDSNLPNTSFNKTKQKPQLNENYHSCGTVTEKYNTAREVFSSSQHQKEFGISPEMFDTATSNLDSNTNNIVGTNRSSTVNLPTKVFDDTSIEKVSIAKDICQNVPKLTNSFNSKIKEITENNKVDASKNKNKIQLKGSHTAGMSNIIEETEMERNEKQINSAVLESNLLVGNIDENLTPHQQENKTRNALTQINSVIFEDVQLTKDNTMNIKTDEDMHANYVSEKVSISVQNKLKISKFNKENYSGIHKETEIGNKKLRNTNVCKQKLQDTKEEVKTNDQFTGDFNSMEVNIGFQNVHSDKNFQKISEPNRKEKSVAEIIFETCITNEVSKESSLHDSENNKRIIKKNKKKKGKGQAIQEVTVMKPEADKEAKITLAIENEHFNELQDTNEEIKTNKQFAGDFDSVEVNVGFQNVHSDKNFQKMSEPNRKEEKNVAETIFGACKTNEVSKEPSPHDSENNKRNIKKNKKSKRKRKDQTKEEVTVMKPEDDTEAKITLAIENEHVNELQDTKEEIKTNEQFAADFYSMEVNVGFQNVHSDKNLQKMSERNRKEEKNVTETIFGACKTNKISKEPSSHDSENNKRNIKENKKRKGKGKDQIIQEVTVMKPEDDKEAKITLAIENEHVNELQDTKEEINTNKEFTGDFNFMKVNIGFRNVHSNRNFQKVSEPNTKEEKSVAETIFETCKTNEVSKEPSLHDSENNKRNIKTNKKRKGKDQTIQEVAVMKSEDNNEAKITLAIENEDFNRLQENDFELSKNAKEVELNKGIDETSVQQIKLTNNNSGNKTVAKAKRGRRRLKKTKVTTIKSKKNKNVKLRHNHIENMEVENETTKIIDQIHDTLNKELDKQNEVKEKIQDQKDSVHAPNLQKPELNTEDLLTNLTDDWKAVKTAQKDYDSKQEHLRQPENEQNTFTLKGTALITYDLVSIGGANENEENKETNVFEVRDIETQPKIFKNHRKNRAKTKSNLTEPSTNEQESSIFDKEINECNNGSLKQKTENIRQRPKKIKKMDDLNKEVTQDEIVLVQELEIMTNNLHSEKEQIMETSDNQKILEEDCAGIEESSMYENVDIHEEKTGSDNISENVNELVQNGTTKNGTEINIQKLPEDQEKSEADKALRTNNKDFANIKNGINKCNERQCFVELSKDEQVETRVLDIIEEEVPNDVSKINRTIRKNANEKSVTFQQLKHDNTKILNTKTVDNKTSYTTNMKVYEDKGKLIQLNDNGMDQTRKSLNQTVSTTTSSRRKRKLYNPDDLTVIETINPETELNQISVASNDTKNIEVIELVKDKNFNNSISELMEERALDIIDLTVPTAQRKGKTKRRKMNETIPEQNKKPKSQTRHKARGIEVKKQTSKTKATHKLEAADFWLPKNNIAWNKSVREKTYKSIFSDVLKSFEKELGYKNGEEKSKDVVRKTKKRHTYPMDPIPKATTDWSATSKNFSVRDLRNKQNTKKQINIISNITIAPPKLPRFDENDNTVDISDDHQFHVMDTNKHKANEINLNCLNGVNVNAKHTPLVSKPAPFWQTTAVFNGEFILLRSTDYLGKYLVLFFYPLDFTTLCRTEIVQLSKTIEEFRSLNTDVVACSVDSHLVHQAWINVSKNEEGLENVNIPLLTDLNHSISKNYGVLLDDLGHCGRAFFIIDPKGIIRHLTIYDLHMGSHIDEVLRLVKALQHVDYQENSSTA